MNISQIKEYFESFTQKSKIAKSILDQNGNFIIFNNQTCKLFDQNQKQLFKKSIFDLMIPFSKYQLKKEKFGDEIQYTIYSQTLKKKCITLIKRNSSKKSNKKQQKKDQETNYSQELSFDDFLKIEDNQQNPDFDIFYKYLKSLYSKIIEIELGFNQNQLAQFFQNNIELHINKDYKFFKQILSNQGENCQIQKFYLLETQNSLQPQKFNYELMKQLDKKIIKWEKCINQKTQYYKKTQF